jgi:hypothetical protein
MTEIPQAAQRARQMYAQGVGTRAILAETKLSLHAFYNWLDGRAQPRGPQLLPALPRRKIVRRARISPGDRVSLVERMMRSSERQVAEIEKRIGTADDQGDKDARTMALIARTLRELTAVDALSRAMGEQPTKLRKGRPANDEGESIPTDVDQLRQSLARKLEAIIAEGGDMLAGEPDSA